MLNSLLPLHLFPISNIKGDSPFLISSSWRSLNLTMKGKWRVRLKMTIYFWRSLVEEKKQGSTSLTCVLYHRILMKLILVDYGLIHNSVAESCCIVHGWAKEVRTYRNPSSYLVMNKTSWLWVSRKCMDIIGRKFAYVCLIVVLIKFLTNFIPE